MTTAHAGTTQSNFRYEAVDRHGNIVTGTLAGHSEGAVRTTLRARGLLPSRLDRAPWLLSVGRRAISPADIALTLRMLATLFSSGLSAARAIAVMAPLAPKSVVAVLPEIERALQDGAPLSTALQSAIPALPASTSGILQAGEAGGDLSLALGEAARLAEETLALRSALISALAYPALLAMASTLVVGLLTGVVIPRFAVVLEDLGQALPPTTIALLTASSWIRALGAPAVLAVSAGLAVAARVFAREDQRARWHAALLRVPLLGALRHSVASARVMSFLAGAIATGLPVPRGMTLAAGASADRAVRARVLEAHRLVLQGSALAAALRETRAVSDVSLRLLSVGEESGRLVEMLRRAATIEAASTQTKLSALLRVLEPVLILLLGSVVTFIAVALLQAVYSVRPGV